jgi:fibronectin type 3 domain-containing protein
MDLVITITDSNANLSWIPVGGARSYKIYRSQVPYFNIIGTIPLATVTMTSFVDSNAVNVGEYYYKVTAVSTAGD